MNIQNINRIYMQFILTFTVYPRVINYERKNCFKIKNINIYYIYFAFDIIQYSARSTRKEIKIM